MRLSSSNFAAAMGLDPFVSRAKLWRLMNKLESRPNRPPMEWGRKNEARAIACVEAQTGLLFTTRPKQYLTPSGTFSTTPDGLCEAHGKKIGVEAKCPIRAVYDEVPKYNMPQIQGQMWILGLDLVYFVAWMPAAHRIWLVHRSEKYIEKMLPMLEEFHKFLGRTGPPPRLNKRPVMPKVKTIIVGESC